MFLFLFLKRFAKFLKCDICPFSKYNWTTFHLSFIKNIKLFDLIQSDVRGSTLILNIYGVRWFVLISSVK